MERDHCKIHCCLDLGNICNPSLSITRVKSGKKLPIKKLANILKSRREERAKKQNWSSVHIVEEGPGKAPQVLCWKLDKPHSWLREGRKTMRLTVLEKCSEPAQWKEEDEGFCYFFLIAQRRSVSSLYEIKNRNAQIIFESSHSYSLMLKQRNIKHGKQERK